MPDATLSPFVVEWMDPRDLMPHPLNWAEHGPEQSAALNESLTEFDFVEPCLWNRRTGTLIDGHARVAWALSRGRAVPVHPIDVDEKTERRLLAMLPRIAEMRGRDEARLHALLSECLKDHPTPPPGWDGKELVRLAKAFAPSAPPELDTLALAPPSRTTPGDLWACGRHRLACLDARESESYDRLLGSVRPALVFADPPYGVNIVQTSRAVRTGNPDIPFGGKKRGSVGGDKPFGSKGRVAGGTPGKTKVIPAGRYAPIAGDDDVETAVTVAHHLLDRYPQAAHVWWGGNYYADRLPPSSCWYVWDKENTGVFADVELAWTNQAKAARLFTHQWNGMLKASERGERRVHPTQKPVALAEWVLSQTTTAGDAVLDPFLGSGMALVAAERAGRACYGLELSPEYCDVVLARWETLTGETPRKISGDPSP